jgi:hypothetical protein
MHGVHEAIQMTYRGAPILGLISDMGAPIPHHEPSDIGRLCAKMEAACPTEAMAGDTLSPAA